MMVRPCWIAALLFLACRASPTTARAWSAPDVGLQAEPSLPFAGVAVTTHVHAWPPTEEPIPANLSWIVLDFEPAVPRRFVDGLVLASEGVQAGPRWILAEGTAEIERAILWGPFVDPRCSEGEVETLCSGVNYTLQGLGNSAPLAEWASKPPITEAPRWLDPGRVDANDRAVRLRRVASVPCLLRGVDVAGESRALPMLVDLGRGEAVITEILPDTTYDWSLECVDAAGNATPLWAVQPRTSPVASVVLSELVVDPVLDWNDSSGVAGVPFDAEPGPNAAATATDEWVELENQGERAVDVGDWQVVVRDGDFSSVRVRTQHQAKPAQAYSPSGTTVLGPGERLVVRLSPPGRNAGRAARLELTDALGLVRDGATLGEAAVPLGESSAPEDEAIARCGDHWKKTSATPGHANACQ